MGRYDLGGGGWYQSATVDIDVQGRDQVRGAGDDFRSFQSVVGETAGVFDRTTTATAKLDQAIQNQAKVARDATQASTAQAAANSAVADSADRAAASANKAATAAGATGKAASDFSVAGPLGAMNNLGPIAGNVAKAFGAGATAVNLWAAALEVGGAVLYGVYKNWDVIVGAFSDGLPKQPIADIKELKKELEGLTAKPWKTVIDYADISTLLIQIGEAERRKAALAKADRPTEAQADRAKAVDKAVAETGDGTVSGKDKVINAAAAASPVAESQATREARERARSLDAQISDRALETMYPEVHQAKVEQRAELEVLLKELARSDRESHRTAVGDKVGDALSGQEGARAWLENLFNANKGVFARFQIGDDFGKALGAASPAAMAKAEKDKETEKAAKDAIRIVGDAFEGQILRPLAEIARNGGDLKQAAAALNPGLAAGFRDRNVPADVAAKAAEMFLQQQGEKARNLAATGGMTPGEKKESDAARTALDKGIGDAFQAVKDAFAGNILERLTREGRAGGDIAGAAEGLRGNLAAQVGARLPGSDEKVIAGVVSRLLSEGSEDARNILANGKKTSAERAADAARTKAINDAASGYAGADQAEAELFRRNQRGEMATQEQADRARADIRGRIAGDLAPFGKDVAEGAADKIIAKIDDAVAKHVSNNTKPTLINRGIAQRKQDANAVDDGFLAPVESAIAENRLAIESGVPVVKNRREMEAAQGLGMPYALPEPELRKELQQRVGVDLRETGQDPSLAADVVQRGFDQVGKMTTAASASTANVVQALSVVVAQLADQQAKDKQKYQGIMQRLDMIRQQQALSRNQLPSAAPLTPWSMAR